MSSASSGTTQTARRHDLDALRAIAMLAGIGLHGMISFIPPPNGWAVTDSQTSPFFKYLMSSVHGFRMPLFFLISGFFTMMLLRKRGLWSLLKQRFVRIFVPLAIGLVTIIPAVWVVSIYVGAMAATNQVKDKDVAVAAAESDVADADRALDAISKTSSCWLIAATGKTKELKEFISAGGDVNHREEDGSTALHGAMLFGRSETAAMLIQAGADPEANNLKGESCLDMLSAPWGITAMVAGMVQVPFDQEVASAGRSEIASYLKIEDPTGDLGGNSEWGSLTLGLFYFPLMGHLWFLWFLCWLVAGFALCVALGRLAHFPTIGTSWTLRPWRYLVMIPLTMIAMTFMQQSGGFGPETSLGLLPLPAVLAYYALFFGFGALYFDGTGGGADQESDGQRRRSWMAVVIAVTVLFPAGMASRSSGGDAERVLSLFSQSAYAWLMTFGLMGVFRHLLSRESRVMRYLSDSSYWLYLTHIPLVIYLQYMVMDSALSAFIKFPLVCLATSILLLISYHLFVRFTPIGTLLNGKRYYFWRASSEPPSMISSQSDAVSPVFGSVVGSADHPLSTVLLPETRSEGSTA